jgi:hypothetical protein
MATVTDMIEKNITLIVTTIMIDNGATTSVPIITIAVKTGMGMTSKIAVSDATTTATVIATAAGATTTGAPLHDCDQLHNAICAVHVAVPRYHAATASAVDVSVHAPTSSSFPNLG